MSGCPDELLTALVDGALDHAERDRVHAHLARCPSCRTEADQLRRLKARLSGLSQSTPPPPAGLVEQLRALAAPGADPLRAPTTVASAPVSPRAPARPRGAARPDRGPSHRRARRSSLVGGTLVVAGAVVVLLAGGHSAQPASTPVDPGSDAFVVDFVSTTGGVPLADPAGAAVSLPSR
ncbi:MAG: anti-sigma factor family protein [Actinomycetes bacterium]